MLDRQPEIKVVLVHLDDEIQYVIYLWAYRVVECQLEYFVQFVSVDAFIPASVGDLGYRIEDGAADEAFEYLDEAVLCSHDGLVGDVLTFRLTFGLLTCHDDREHCLRAERFGYLLGRCIRNCCVLLRLNE